MLAGVSFAGLLAGMDMMATGTVAAAVAVTLMPTFSFAQGLPRVEVSAGTTPSAPTITLRDVLAEKPFDELLRNGFPTRLHLRAELWTIGRWFDALASSEDWDVVVSYDLIDRTYDVARYTRTGTTPLGSYSTFSDARAASELVYNPELKAPSRGKRGYIVVQVDVQTVAMSDLDEVQRWLRGEVQPAVKGQKNPTSALGTGVRTLVTRLLGGEVRHLEARSPTIVF